jgi:hypothetical protein
MVDNKKSGSTKSGVSHMKRNAALVVLLVVVVGAALFYNFYLGGGVIGIASGALSNPAALKGMIIQTVASTPEITLNYAGTIRANVTPPNGSDPLVSIPFSLSYMKYYNDTRMNFTLVGNPSLGIASVSAVSVQEDTNVTLCYNINDTGFTCAASPGGTTTEIFQNLTRELNISSIVNVGVSGAMPSLYNWAPCWAVTGSGTVNADSMIFGGSNANMSFSACVSTKYDVPLWLKATITESNGERILVNITANQLSHTSSRGEATALPG